MNVIKEYNTAKKKKGNVTFGSIHGGRWSFRCSDKESGSIEKLMTVPGGRDVAEKIAEVISKSWLRTAGKKLESAERIDARARKQIDHLTHLRTLADWKGEPEWWSNSAGAEPIINMIYINQQKPVEQPAGISAEDLHVTVTPEQAPVVEAEPIGEAVTA